jgi:hypothetical protein
VHRKWQEFEGVRQSCHCLPGAFGAKVVSMDTTQLQGLIGTLAVIGLLVLVALPAIVGVVHDRRVDRQLRRAQERRASHHVARAA